MQQSRAVIYLRISLDKNGDGLAIERQKEDCERIVTTRGWRLVGTYTDQSISATDKSKCRPAYDSMVDDYNAGLFEAIVCWDLDRLTRQPRQLEDWIDAAEDKGLIIVTANGEADLSTDAGRLFARIKAAVARSEVERNGKRQRRKNQQRIDSGHFGAGRAPYGYAQNEIVVAKQACTVQSIYQAFLRGVSVVGIARALSGQADVVGLARADSPGYVHAQAANRRRSAKGVEPKPLPANRWTETSVRTILRNPRYAGFSTYKRDGGGYHPIIALDANGEPIMGKWEPIVDVETFWAVQTIMDDPSRQTRRIGTERRHIGTGLYRCGICGGRVSVSKDAYVCPGHITRTRDPLDLYVNSMVAAELGRIAQDPSMLPVGDGSRERELRNVIDSARRQLERAQDDYDAELIEARDLKRIRERVERKAREASDELSYLLKKGTVSPILFMPDPAGVFAQADSATKRSIVESLFQVELLPVVTFEYGRAFNPEYVRITRIADNRPVRMPNYKQIAGKTCPTCGRPMLLADGCLRTLSGRKGEVKRVKVGGCGDPYEGKRYARCEECNASWRHFHHLGCSKEICPVCGGQLATCGCFDLANAGSYRGGKGSFEVSSERSKALAG